MSKMKYLNNKVQNYRIHKFIKLILTISSLMLITDIGKFQSIENPENLNTLYFYFKSSNQYFDKLEILNNNANDGYLENELLFNSSGNNF